MTSQAADLISKEDKPFEFISRPSGLTLIEALVLVLVIVILVISIYIGVVFAEKQLVTNYRDRVATLLVTGELEMEYYRRTRNQPFLLHNGTEFVIDELGKNKVLTGRMTIELRRGQESSNEQLLDFVYLVATLTWRDPFTKEQRYIRMREDYFI